MIALGLMSGTSLDGIDAALADILPAGDGYTLRTRRFITEPFSPAFAARLRAALPPNRPAPAEVAALDAEFGAALAAAGVRAAGNVAVDFVASHGLTLYHDGAAALTAQIGSPYALRDALHAPVVFDLRRADCARGGHGAPLVPYFDALTFGSPREDVVALNLGGIANVAVIPRGHPEQTFGWDTGPGNMLLDGFVRDRTNGAQTFDRDGAFAMAGTLDERVLAELFASEADYFAAEPPKSTGRERFGTAFAQRHAAAFAALSIEDGCATLAAFTVESVARALEAHGPRTGRLVVSGGGAHNVALLRGLANRLAPAGWTVVTTGAFGIDPDAKEALAFAVLGYEALRGRPAGMPLVTGASAPAFLGAIVPWRLDAVMAKMRAELAANGAA